MSPSGINQIMLRREIGEINPRDHEKNFLVDSIDIGGNQGLMITEKDPEVFSGESRKQKDLKATALITEDGKHGTPHIEVRTYPGERGQILRGDILGTFVLEAVKQTVPDGVAEKKGVEVKVNSEILADDYNTELFANLGYTAIDEGNHTSLLVKNPTVEPIQPQQAELQLAA